MSSTEPSSIFGILYKVDEPHASQMCDQSRALNELNAGEISLAAEVCFPHITVAHMKCDLESANSVWYELLALGAAIILQFEVGGMYVNPHRDGALVGDEIVSSPELVELHQNLVRLCDLHDIEIVSEAREKYWPHVTLTFWRRDPNVDVSAFELSANQITGSLVLSEMGKHGAAVKIIH